MTETLQVEDLWFKRYKILQPKKRRRLKRFLNVFPPVMEEAARRHEFSSEEVRNHPYFEYLRKDYRHWQREPLPEQAENQIRHRFYEAIRLLWDIRNRGMVDPLEMVRMQSDPGMYLMLGYRRFVILHTLRIGEARVLFHDDYDAYLESQKAKKGHT